MVILQYTWRLLVPKAEITFEPSASKNMPLSWLPEGGMKTCLRTTAPTDVVASREVRLATLLLDFTSIKDEAAFLKTFHVPHIIKLCGHVSGTVSGRWLASPRSWRTSLGSRAVSTCSSSSRIQ